MTPKFNLYDRNWPIYTLWHNDPPAKTVFAEPLGRNAHVVDSMLCNGSIVSGSRVRRSILSNRVYTGEDTEIEDSIIMSGVEVGDHVVLKKVIVDKWVKIPSGTQIGVNLEEDRKRFTVTDSGIVVVPRGYDFEARRRKSDRQVPSDSDFASL